MRTIATIFAIFGIILGSAGIAHADPTDTGSGGAKIEDSSGTGSGGAKIDPVGTGSSGAKIDPIGTGSPDYSKPSPKPSQGKSESDTDYNLRVSGWEAGERARIANLNASKGQSDDREDFCTLHPEHKSCPTE